MALSYFLLCFLTLNFWVQDLPKNDAPPRVTIVKYKWQRIGAGPTLDASFKAESDSPNGSTSDPNTPAQASGISDRDIPFFMYSVEVKNEGNKSIKAILWDYLIIDGSSKEELGRHEFVSFEKVSRNSVKTLTVRSRVTPSRIVTVQDSPPTANSTVVEQVMLKCVVYDDGTVWQQSPAWEQGCEALRKRAKN
jgi:hypothetical protein